MMPVPTMAMNSSSVSTTSTNSPAVFFDDLSKIRVLDAASAELSVKLQDQSREFSGDLVQLRNLSNSLLALFREKAKAVEEQKLVAIGLRNRVATEQQLRKAQQNRLQTMVKERQSELGRLHAHLDSLQRVLQEQQSTIDRLSSK